MRKMKYLIVVVLIHALLGCGSDSKSNSQDQTPSKFEDLDFQSLDLTGTWFLVQEERRTKIDTGEYISSRYFEYRYVFEDSANGVKFNRCWEYGDFHWRYGVKTAEHFYMAPNDPLDNGFTIKDKNTLEKVTTFEYDSEPGYSFESIQTLTRVSDAVDIDSGTFILSGPIDIAEYNHVCTWQVSSNIGESRTLELLVPYNEGYISMHFELVGEVTAGNYYYNKYWETTEISLDVFSNTAAFWDTVGSNLLGAEDVTINIIDSTSEKLSGTFSLLGQDNENYSGEFEVFFNN